MAVAQAAPLDVVTLAPWDIAHSACPSIQDIIPEMEGNISLLGHPNLSDHVQIKSMSTFLDVVSLPLIETTGSTPFPPSM